MRGKKLPEPTKDEVLKVKSLYALGLNRIEVAQKSGMCEWAVRKILKNEFRQEPKDWKHFSAEKREEKLSNEQLQCFLGTLLGDASLIYRRELYEYQTSHCLEQKEYLEHIANVLNRKPHEYIKCENSFSPGKLYYRVGYNNKTTLEKIAKITTVNYKKSVTEKWVDAIDAIGIAYWFMDDGSSSWYRKTKNHTWRSIVRFSTLSFNEYELKLLQYKLEKYNIGSYFIKCSDKKIKNYENRYEIIIKEKSINIFFDMIEPYIVKCMKYKIKRNPVRQKKENQ